MAEGTKWTEQQQRAIEHRGSDVLVTASAGTGKTAVLSGRCVNIVSDKSICPDVLNVLVLTFTEAAAEQMRRRIAEQLRDVYLESRNPHLYHQLILLQGADISTIHSFCKRLITEYFYKLRLDPTFRVIDSDEAKLLKAEVLEKTIDWAWEQEYLVQGLHQLLYRRDLRAKEGFAAKIIDLSDFLNSLPSRGSWYQKALLLAEAVSPFETSLGGKLRIIMAEKLEHIVSQLRYAQRLYQSQTTERGWTIEQSHIEPVVQCSEFLRAGDLERCVEIIRDFKKPTTRTPKGLDENIAELIHDTAKGALDEFKNLSELAVFNPDYLDKISGAGLQTKVVIELVRKFDQLYSQAKRAINCLDFADLEQYAMELLADEKSSDDKPVPSETALLLRGKYKYIFIDEYQDINPVQKTILEMLSGKGNTFVVGDVKQSIYAFRGAEPKIFVEDLRSASPNPQNAPDGLRVDLNTNWRSNKGILDFVNKMFGRIMTASFADIDYDESAKLKPALENETGKADSAWPTVELHILDEQSKDTDTQDERESESDNDEVSDKKTYEATARQKQAAVIAQRIRQMVGEETGKAEFQIYDKQQGRMRDVGYRDIVILMRSPAERVNDYVDVLRLAGVPVNCEDATGYFELTEISDMLCLMRVLDNPQRDIELAAVLRSWFFKINDSELAKIRALGRINKDKMGFYDCVSNYSVRGKDAELAGRLKRVLEQIEQWRTLARSGSLADLIWRIYRQSRFLSFVSALPNGRQRRANLLKLHQRAIQFEGFAGSGAMVSLTRFVEFIEKLQETGADWASAEPGAEAGNAVRIISVHKSKGLEYPVVFLAELDGQFNKRDIQDDFLADADNTLGLRIIDRQSNTKVASIAHRIIAEERLATGLAEEMRILYVAMTRARERLILTASEKKKRCRDIISRGFFFGDKPIPDWQLRRCRGHLDWILYALSNQKGLHEAFGTGLGKDAENGGLVEIKLYEQDEIGQFSDYIKGLRENKLGSAKSRIKGSKTGSGEEMLGKIKESLAWRYQFGEAAELPAKLSVTQLTHHNDEYVSIDYSRELGRKPGAVMSGEDGSAEKPDGRVIGAAVHSVIAQIDLSKPVTEKAVEEIKERLLAEDVIAKGVMEYVRADLITGFFESELGKAVLDTDNTVWREWPFSFAAPAADVGGVGDLGEEIVVVQGIIDILVRTPKGLLVIDLKTDNISAGEAVERAKFYQRQLDFYGRAAEKILGEKAAGRWLYFLKPGCAAEV
jgi:ATP-dependent helicase/nuclease subunit A